MQGEQRNSNYKYHISGMAKFQYSSIARSDDTARFEKEDLTPNNQFPFSLLFHLFWGKKVREERDDPEQVLFGAEDHLFCVLLGFAIHLELSLQNGYGTRV